MTFSDLYDSGEVGSSLILGVAWECSCGRGNVWMFDRNKVSAYRDDAIYETCCVHCDKRYRVKTGRLDIDITVNEAQK